MNAIIISDDTVEEWYHISKQTEYGMFSICACVYHY